MMIWTDDGMKANHGMEEENPMMLLVTGGSASGKSEYAEKRAMDMAGKMDTSLLYLAAMMPFGEEARERIQRHRALRDGKGFETIERYTDIFGLCRGSGKAERYFQERAAGATVLLECMSNLTANEIFGEGAAGADTDTAVLEGVRAMQRLAENLIIVTIDVFGDGRVYDDGTENYRRCLGRLNSRLAAMADEVVEVVYTIPLVLKSCGHDSEEAAACSL